MTSFHTASEYLTFTPGIQDSLEGNEQRLNVAQNKINSLSELMDQYLSEIRNKAKDYETC